MNSSDPITYTGPGVVVCFRDGVIVGHPVEDTILNNFGRQRAIILATSGNLRHSSQVEYSIFSATMTLERVGNFIPHRWKLVG